MRGPVGSSIEITVRRRGVKKALIFNITREIIEIQSVKSKTIKGSSVITAKFNASILRANPGPELPVIPSEPP